MVNKVAMQKELIAKDFVAYATFGTLVSWAKLGDGFVDVFKIEKMGSGRG